jgi:hypothetical protein
MTVTGRRPTIRPQSLYFHQSFGPRRRRPTRYPAADTERTGWFTPVMGALWLAGLVLAVGCALAVVSLVLYGLVALGNEIASILKEAWLHG